ncbi:MAG: EF-Tu/IF-2/RF-3 family GTPase [Opitutaceae bacterium]|jgi:elongation factor Tu
MADDIRMPVFQFTVEDVFSIAGRGVVVTGTVARGAVRVGEKLLLRQSDGKTIPIEITAIEGFKKILKEALMGENVGLSIQGLPKEAIRAGDTISFE